ncbi:hypothetical protein ACFYWO_36220 [Streptomyces sp. NPDC002932]
MNGKPFLAFLLSTLVALELGLLAAVGMGALVGAAHGFAHRE